MVINPEGTCPESIIRQLNTLQVHFVCLLAYRKDRENSDSMDAPCDIIKLPWIYRKALLVLNNMEVEDTDEYIKTTLKAGGLMDVVSDMLALQGVLLQSGQQGAACKGLTSVLG